MSGDGARNRSSLGRRQGCYRKTKEALVDNEAKQLGEEDTPVWPQELLLFSFTSWYLISLRIGILY